jgi:ADP-ribosylglycohydrolase
MTAQALLASRSDPDRFTRSLAWRLRWWLAGLPAGVGLATGRAILKLWLGFPATKSGVWSAGNGPAMRAAILGVALADDPVQLRAFVRRSTRLTHTDPKAEQGALVIALAASRAARSPGERFSPESILHHLENEVDDLALRALLQLVREHLRAGSSAVEFAAAHGCAPRGVSGYMYHTVPAVLFCWLRAPHDFRQSITDIVSLGGDADTTAALLGALAGASLGPGAIPDSWLRGIVDWPRTKAWLKRLGGRLADQHEGLPAAPLPLFWPAIPLRNAAFLLIVLAHGFRRLLPPY